MDFLLGSIMCFAFNYNPQGCMLCNGQTLSINSNQALFSLIGNQFGGDGSTTFCLPNLNGASRFNGMMKYYIAIQGIYPSRN
jgi:microcystin-dependent protein